MRGCVVLEGLICVEAAVEAASRPIAAIYIADDVPGERVRSLVLAAGRRGRPVTRVPRAEVEALAIGRCHGGILALVGRRRLLSLDALLHKPRLRDGPVFLAMLDGVEDPFHFGQAIRALYAAGATGLLVGARDWTNAATVVARSSAGASERIPMAAAPHIPDLIARLRRAEIQVVCAHHHGDRSVYEADFTGALLLVIGGHRRGLSRPWADAADTRVALPYARPFAASLDITSATAVIAFEIARQRRTRPGRPAVSTP